MRTSDVTQLMDLALGLWFPFVRIMAFLRYVPVLDNSALTVRVRIILSLALAIIITPLIPHPIPHDLLSLNSLILTVEQILWGMLFGLMFQFLFLALQLAGQILSFNMGMSMAVMNDPSSGASTTVLAELINVYAILLFFAMDGHLLLVSVLYKGFTYWPIGNALHPQTLRTIALAFSWVLASASLLALPTTFIMLIVQGCFGLLNRIAPPLNLFSLGFPINMLAGLAASLFAAFVVISSSFPWYADFVRESFISVHQYAQEINNPEVIGQFLRHHLLILGKFILTLLPMPAAALLSSLVPGGWLFLPKKILPDFSKISPLKGIGRLFSSEHLAETGKMTVKSVVVLVMLWVSLRNNFAAFLGLQALPFKLAMNEGLSLYACVMRNFVILFIFFALIDVPLAKALFTKGLKMTKQELKEEYKNQEGKPEVKARVRRLQRQLAMGQIRKVVPKANVVITNPTHYAVALQYDSSRAAAPFVVAKGTDEIALYIRQVAAENQVEVVEFPRLARSVYYTTQVNQQIPFQLYRAIAHVLTYVLQMKHWREGAQPRPALNRHISIPKEVLKLDGENN